MYATWFNEEKRTGRMALVAGMDHAHETGQTTCMICVSNMKEDISWRFYKASLKAAQLKAARIMLAMMTIFDHGGKLPQTKKVSHAEQRRIKRARRDAKQ